MIDDAMRAINNAVHIPGAFEKQGTKLRSLIDDLCDKMHEQIGKLDYKKEGSTLEELFGREITATTNDKLAYFFQEAIEVKKDIIRQLPPELAVAVVTGQQVDNTPSRVSGVTI